MPTEIETKALEEAQRALMSELFLVCQPDRGDVFSFMDDRPKVLEVAIRAYLAALEPLIREQGVGVKALEWRCVGNGIWEAGHHQVWHQWASDGLWYSSVNVGHRKIERIGDGFKSLEEAQSACQADFNRRILSALSPERKEPGWREVLAERRRQVEAEGWTPGHDDGHVSGEMAAAAACYAFTAVKSPHYINQIWPWSYDWWKPRDKRRNLVKAGALILAEIERLDRASSATPGQPT